MVPAVRIAAAAAATHLAKTLVNQRKSCDVWKKNVVGEAEKIQNVDCYFAIWSNQQTFVQFINNRNRNNISVITAKR